jgi:hypothetical protein
MANTHTAVARNAGAAGLSSPLWSFPAVPSCLTRNFTVRSDARAREDVRWCMSPTNTAGPFLAVPLSLFPCLVHAINFVSLPWPCRRRSARTQTHATEGPSPCFTYL